MTSGAVSTCGTAAHGHGQTVGASACNLRRRRLLTEPGGTSQDETDHSQGLKGERRLIILTWHNTEDLPQQLAPGTSASILSRSTPTALGAQLIGFHCLVCGYLLRAENRHPSSAPMCAGSRARAGKQHEPAQMEALFIR